MSTASAAASSGNIGPGFDVLALALGLRCSVAAQEADEWSVAHRTALAPPAGAEDLALETARELADRPLALEVTNEIPLGKGLGSSSAVRAAAAAATWRACGASAEADRVFRYVAGIEGHPDNAAAAVFGGLVAVTPDGAPLPLPLSSRWRVVLAIPDEVLPTKEARGVLDDTIPRAVVVRSLARLTALLEGLRSGDADVLAAATWDELHEAPRARLNPTADDLIRAARDAGAPHAAWSGAGPSVIAFADIDSVDHVAAALRSTMGDGEVRAMDVDTTGLVCP